MSSLRGILGIGAAPARTGTSSLCESLPPAHVRAQGTGIPAVYITDPMVISLPAAAPARQRRKDARPQELLQAALELFVEKGFSAARSEEVAARAGVAKGTLYPSKEELFKAVVRSKLSTLIAEGRQRAEQYTGPSAELLRLLMHGWWNQVGDTAAGGIFKIVFAEVRHFPELAKFYSDEVIVPAQRLISRTLQRGIDRGEFRKVPLDETTQALIAPLLYLALQKHSIAACAGMGLRLNPAALIDTHIDLMLHGLERRAAAPKRKP
jgi:AcrR family transcriptional regulator